MVFWASSCQTLVFREKIRELNNEVMKKNSVIEDMEVKHSSSSECGSVPLCEPTVVLSSNLVLATVLSAQRVDELEDALKKKDEDMKQMEERYKKYLEKAKSVSGCSRLAVTIATTHPHQQTCPLQVIRTLDPKQNQGSGPEVQALKNQLQEKERMLHSLEVPTRFPHGSDPARAEERAPSGPPLKCLFPPHRRRWTRPKVKGITRRR